MTAQANHIISQFRLETAFDQKERAAELQQRISDWCRLHLPGEMENVLNRICPPEQVWKIRELSIDLGELELDELETGLTEKLCLHLRQQLIDLLIYSGNGNAAIEITDRNSSHLDILSGFLLYGILSWNYQQAHGSANELLADQLAYNFSDTIKCLIDIGATGENVRKRMAWQISEPNLALILKGLEPVNHRQIIDFSTEMIQVQQQEKIVQAGIDDFKKNLWLWVLNYLYSERGSVFNKIAFVKSSIRQMAAHYNISYLSLLQMIDRALNHIKAGSVVVPDLIMVLKEITKENQVPVHNLPADQQDYWKLLGAFLHGKSVPGFAMNNAMINELVLNLSKENSHRFRSLLLTVDADHWDTIIPSLNDASLAALLFSLDEPNAGLITETIQFLMNMGKELHFRLDKKQLWKDAFLVLHRNEPLSRFNRFLLQCIQHTANENNLSQFKLVEQLLSAGIPRMQNKSAGTEMRKGLFACLADSGKHADTALLEEHLQQLIHGLCLAFTNGTAVDEPFVKLRQRLFIYARSHPRETLQSLMLYEDRKVLQQLFPFLYDDVMAALLPAGNAEDEYQLLLEMLRRYIQRTQKAGLFDDAFYSNGNKWMELRLRAMLFHKKKDKGHFLESVLHELFNTLPWQKAKQFSVFVAAMFDDGIGFSGIGKEATDRIRHHYASKALMSLDTAIISLMHETDEPMPAIADLLQAEPEAAVWKNLDSCSVKLIDMLVPGAAAVKQELLQSYLSVVKTKVISENTAERLETLFWLSLSDIRLHNKNLAVFLDHYKASVLCRFPLEPEDLALKSIADNAQHSFADILDLLGDCLRSGRTSIHAGAETFSLQQLADRVLKMGSKKVFQLLTDFSDDERMVRKLQLLFSIKDLGSILAIHEKTAVQEAAAAIGQLWEIVCDLSGGQEPEQLQEYFHNALWQLLEKTEWADREMEQLAETALRSLEKDTVIRAPHLAAMIRENAHTLLPSVRKVLVKLIGPLDTLLPAATEMTTDLLLHTIKSKGLLDELAYALLFHARVPQWANVGWKQDAGELLDRMVLFDIRTVLSVFRNSSPDISAMKKLAGWISVDKLCREIGRLYRNRRPLLDMLSSLYTALAYVQIEGVATWELQAVLLQKIVGAAANDHWQLFSGTGVWNELIWEITARKHISRNKIMAGLLQAKMLFPPALQSSLQHLKDKQPPVYPLQPGVKITKPAARRLPEKTPLLEAGIMVRNAGMVLLNSYIPMLFERLGLIADEAFVSEEARMRAVHYLQFVVTGLTETDEAYLPLNKLLCGYQLDEPVTDRIAIPGEERNMIEGLIDAAISYWPALGSCSVDGFRGNWLVRNGLLIEEEEKWELTVEKKAYDLLIGKSPFSFSIIRYPWMAKALHVKWSY